MWPLLKAENVRQLSTSWVLYSSMQSLNVLQRRSCRRWMRLESKVISEIRSPPGIHRRSLVPTCCSVDLPRRYSSPALANQTQAPSGPLPQQNKMNSKCWTTSTQHHELTQSNKPNKNGFLEELCADKWVKIFFLPAFPNCLITHIYKWYN